MKICYVITEKNGKKFWNRIGAAFENKDGSLNVKLDSLPIGGEMQIREYVPRDGDASAAGKGQRKEEDDDAPF
jgi:hypothetical protein